MKTQVAQFLLSAALTLSASADSQPCIVTNCADVTRILRDGTNAYVRFELEVRALSDIGEFGRGLMVADKTGATILGPNEAMDDKPRLRNGDRFSVSGRVCTPPGQGRFTRAEKIVRLGHGEPYVPPTISAEEFVRSRDDLRPIRLHGIVRNLLFDEIDPAFAFLVIEGSNTVAYAACRYWDRSSRPSGSLVGAEVALTGVRELTRPTYRRQMGQSLITTPDRLEILKPPPADAFAVPPLEELALLGPMEIARSGPHRAQGTVLAVWKPQQFLMRLANGNLTRVELTEGPMPRYGTTVEAVGFPVTDPYHINLVRAQWRHSTDLAPADVTPPEDVRSSDILRAESGKPLVDPSYHGQTLRITGTLVDHIDASRLCLQDGTGLVTIDTSACADTADCPIGSTVRATGVCVMDVAAWQPHETLPQIKGFTLVTRSSDDLEVLARPPWWTPARLWTAIAILCCLIAGILAWNASLRILADRRGQALLRGEIAQIASRLKVEERTRLAVELHDSLSQTLAGVAMEVAAADDLRDKAEDETSVHLARAAQTLKSCRDELRNCLWDLRSKALDEPDMAVAIRRTLEPQIDESQLEVCFDVPRTRVSDNTAHALLRMIRELVVNALRHGQATAVSVFGNLDSDTLRFSVQDNGCGFDPETAPGVLQGHFGLQGIRERLERLGGSLLIESRPDGGTRITGCFPAVSPTRVGVGTNRTA